VRLTTPEIGVVAFERISPPRAETAAKAHWTSRIGSGKTTEEER
jgi:hypothetical protein